MSTAALRLDIAASRIRVRWTMAASVVAHALVLVLLLLRHDAPAVPAITEITWLEPGDLAGEAAPAAVTVGAPSPGAPVAQAHEEHFRRLERSGDVAPEPQSDFALADRMTAKLASQPVATGAPAVLATATLPAGAWSTPAGLGGSGAGGAALALHRGGTGAGSAPSLQLTRGTGAGGAPAVVSTPAAPVERAATAPAQGGAIGARRVLAGATLMGPVADRRVLRHVTPTYPEWAKREGVEGSVSLYFVVRPDGGIKENVLVQKTAGFEEFDDNARAALSEWRFEPLAEGRVGEQWGTITFHYRLNSAQ